MKNSPSSVTGPARWLVKTVLLAVAVAAVGLSLVGLRSDSGVWLTTDQQGERHFKRGEYLQAAEAFSDASWQGVAWYRAGEFEKAAQAFARRDSATACYNQGNAWLMNGKYQTAISCYDRALARRPDWKEAADNRALAVARSERVKKVGGDQGGEAAEPEAGPDQITFNKNTGKGEQDTEVAGGEALSDQQIQALWLRRVQTRPADFLKAKFAYQLATAQEGAK